MTELDPSIILRAGAVQPLQFADILERRAQIQARNLQAQREQQQFDATQKTQARRVRLGALAAGGDFAGARSGALSDGDLDTADKFASMESTERQTKLQKLTAGAQVLYGIKKYTDPAQRAQALQGAIPGLKAQGYSDDEIARIPLDDARIDGALANATSLSDQIKASEEAIKRRTGTLSQGQTMFDNGQVVASVAPKPDYQVVPQGGMAVRVDNGAPSYAAGGGVGGPALGPQIEQKITQFVPGVKVTSRQRTPQHNAAVGGVPNSYHLSDNARDLVPPRGMSLGQLASAARAKLGGGFEVLQESDHVHIEPIRGAQAGGPPGVIMGRAKPGFRTLTQREARGMGLPDGQIYQQSPDNEIKPIGGQRGGATGAAGATKQQIGLARAKTNSLMALEGQIKRVESAMTKMEKDGYSGALLGNVPGIVDPSSNVFDKTVAGLAPLIRQLTRVPGEGAMSDYESRLATLTLPSRTDTKDGRREALAGIKELINNIRVGYNEFLGKPPANSPTVSNW